MFSFCFHSSVHKIQNKGNRQSDQYIFFRSGCRNRSDSRIAGSADRGYSVSHKAVTIFCSSIVWHEIDDIFTISCKCEGIALIAHIYARKPLEHFAGRIPKEDIDLVGTVNGSPSQRRSIASYGMCYIG